MKRRILLFMCAGAIFLLLSACQSIGYGVTSPTNFTETYLQGDMRMFSVSSPNPSNAARDWYFSSYKSVIPNITISSGLYPSEGELLAAHMLEGEDTSQGTIIMIHGFNGSNLYTHYQYFAQQFIKRGYRAILLDLPGHGYSGGRRGSIDDFSKYASMVNDFLKYTDGELGEKIILVGHSTGAIAIYDAYVNYPDVMKQVDAAVLLAPFSDLKNSGLYSVGSFLVEDIRTDKRRPMQLSNFPSDWTRAQSKWTKSLSEYPTLTQRMLIVFGEKDEIIKLNQSIVYYQKKTKQTQMEIYEDQDHIFSKPGYKEFREETVNWILSEVDKKQNQE